MYVNYVTKIYFKVTIFINLPQVSRKPLNLASFLVKFLRLKTVVKHTYTMLNLSTRFIKNWKLFEKKKRKTVKTLCRYRVNVGKVSLFKIKNNI